MNRHDHRRGDPREGAGPERDDVGEFLERAVAAVLIASAAVGTTASHGDYFRADRAWLYIVILTVGYLVSRGFAKSGSREPYDG